MAGEQDGGLLAETVDRRAALEALAEGPLHRKELEDRLDVSKTTCHRIIRHFDDRGIIRRTDDGYRLSRLGEVVAEEIGRAAVTVKTARELEPLLRAFEPTDVAFEISMFVDATVTRAQPDDPYPPISRFMELLRESNTLRSLDRTSIAPLYTDEIFNLIFEEGLEVEAIYPESVVEKLISEYDEPHRRAADVGRMTYRVFDDVTFGMSLFDDRVGLRAYDAGTGALLLFADTDDPEALSWAEEVYDHFREGARVPDWFPDWINEPELRL